MANFYRRFVKGFAAIAKLLTDLTKKDRDFTWNDEEEAAFRKLKEARAKPVALLAPRWYNKMMTRSNGCQWSTCPIDCLWWSKTTTQ